MRMCSITPYFILNNVCAVTSMSSLDYLIGNFGLIPCDIPYIYVGATVSDFTKLASGKQVQTVNIILVCIGLVITLVVVSLVTFYA